MNTTKFPPLAKPFDQRAVEALETLAKCAERTLVLTEAAAERDEAAEQRQIENQKHTKKLMQLQQDLIDQQAAAHSKERSEENAAIHARAVQRAVTGAPDLDMKELHEARETLAALRQAKKEGRWDAAALFLDPEVKPNVVPMRNRQ